MKFDPMIILRTVQETLKPLMETGTNFIKTKMFTVVDMQSIQWDLEDEIRLEYFPHIPQKYAYYKNKSKTARADYSRPPRKTACRYKYVGKQWDAKKKIHSTGNRGLVSDDYKREVSVSKSKGNFIDVYNYCGTKIFFMISNVVSTGDRGDRTFDFRSLAVFNTEKDNKNLDEFIMMLIKNSEKKRAEHSSDEYWLLMEVNQTTNLLKQKRSFENVFILADIESQIKDSMRAFIEKRDWYQDHKIPYHFGILLYGPGGTGKSSIIQAIINEFDTFAYISESLETVVESKEIFLWSSTRDKPVVIICEDIDTDIFTNNRHVEIETKADDKDGIHKKDRKRTLGKLLNFIDGNISPSNVIYIFTTNYIEDLDAALIRPGRIDLCLEIGYIIDETLDKFLMFHYKQHLPNDRHVKPEFTFAELQTDVMKGFTIEHMLEKYTYERKDV